MLVNVSSTDGAFTVILILFLLLQPDNHIIAPAAADSTINTLPQPPPPSASSVIPETANLPFMVDVHDDPRMSSPTTPNFRDAADDFL